MQHNKVIYTQNANSSFFGTNGDRQKLPATEKRFYYIGTS